MKEITKNDIVKYDEALTLIIKTLEADTVTNFESLARDCLAYLTELFIRNDKNHLYGEDRKEIYKDFEPIKNPQIRFLKSQQEILLGKCREFLSFAEITATNKDTSSAEKIKAKLNIHKLKYLEKLIDITFTTESPEPSCPHSPEPTARSTDTSSPSGVSDDLGGPYGSFSFKAYMSKDKPHLSFIDLVLLINSNKPDDIHTAIDTYHPDSLKSMATCFGITNRKEFFTGAVGSKRTTDAGTAVFLQKLITQCNKGVKKDPHAKTIG